MKFILLFSLIVFSLSLKTSKTDPSYENAHEIYNFFKEKEWSLNAICGMLGNMHWESDGLQPDINEMGGSGYGLVQWTPGTKLKTWAEERGLDYTTVNTQCQRIQWELENGEQYYKNKCSYKNFKEFSKSNDSIETLTECFMREYERPAESTAHLQERKEYAQLWYNHLSNNSPLVFTYQVRMSDGTLSEEIENDNSFAGTVGKEITDIAIKVNKGKVEYQVHVIGEEDWLPKVSGYDWHDSNNGYAGKGKVIDMIRITHSEMKPYYRVSKVNGEYYDWQYGDLVDKNKNYDGYAGAKDVKIDRIQIVPCKPKDAVNSQLLEDGEFNCIYAYSSKLNYNLLLLFLLFALI